ncbi:MAG: hypothetical protein U0Y10_17035 [Spirosomataceae bacterium]
MTKLVNVLLLSVILAVDGCTSLIPANSVQDSPILNSGTVINDIKLSDEFTIIYFTYYNNNKPVYNNYGRIISEGMTPIGFYKYAELIALQGTRHFKFVKAEGIPVTKKMTDLAFYGKKTYPGDRVSFIAYFERLDKGIEYFDLYECKESSDNSCWNVQNLHIENPAF